VTEWAIAKWAVIRNRFMEKIPDASLLASEGFCEKPISL